MKSNGIKHPEIGFLEWFHVGEYERVEATLDQLRKLSINQLRTGMSWADLYTDEGKQWYKWLIPRLAKEAEILPCFLYTPPSQGILPKTSSPPRNPKDYADFLDTMVTQYGKYFEWVELWNEPNNKSEYDYTLDWQWNTFTAMIGMAAHWMKHLKKKTLLGGMSPVDPNWLQLMYDREVMKYIDAIGVHHFPHVFDDKWYGWEQLLDQVRNVINSNGGNQKIWITETGYSTWKHDERKQLEMFLESTRAHVERVYWYGLNDLNKIYPTVDGFHTDEREYAFGMVKTDGTEKLLYRLLCEKSPRELESDKWMSVPYIKHDTTDSVLVVGGAGFIGTNMVKTLAEAGEKVTILDNLSRPGVEKNLRWLKTHYPDQLNIEVADIRNEFCVEAAVAKASFVYHFAAQVAVTTSCNLPVMDFDVNARGTLNVLEAIRKSSHQPPMLFTSTNKVYGGLEDLRLVIDNNRYEPEEPLIRESGISELRPLDFHSPYGCSKGIADSYILDYVRTYGLKAVVFRMSCIYGPHQFGTEDQGWIAHFLLKALQGQPINIYGDGKQVRDVLFVEDLIQAMLQARDQMDHLNGKAFNMGGGPANTISLLQLIDHIQELHGEKIEVNFDQWRPGDQRYYVSDTTRFQTETGWKPRISAWEGVEKLYHWLVKYNDQPKKVASNIKLV
ncbi:GDP-mannose 4,6-dehydratase [Telluribacter sp. SYSU D00476]|uniref:GDP-mannose 4,6-dehydratase n=1 Tax=Telluribacter sp. SYSU D00476 TaxID=2811430 RepID=UPI001FF0FD54|nr:GDP-mannose 4,6-dehydratase [Telluribacter sp. SYSU D00476]